MACIGVCDNNIRDIKVNITYIKKALKLLDREANIKVFIKGEDIVEYAKETKVDIVFIDINMKGMNGIMTAHKLLELNPHIVIIFLTRYREVTLDVFEVNAMAYLVKPIDNFNKMKMDLARAFNQINQIKLIKKEQESSILIVTEENTKKKIIQRSILYIEKQKNQCIIYKEDGIHQIYESLAALSKRLDNYFWQINQGIITNKKYIQQIVKNEVFLKNGIIHTLGRKYSKDIKNRFYQMESNCIRNM